MKENGICKHANESKLFFPIFAKNKYNAKGARCEVYNIIIMSICNNKS